MASAQNFKTFGDILSIPMALLGSSEDRALKDQSRLRRWSRVDWSVVLHNAKVQQMSQDGMEVLVE